MGEILEGILEKALEADELIIYGAHLVALECARWLIQKGKRNQILGFAVTDLNENPAELEGLLVRKLDEYTGQGSNPLVIIAAPKRHHQDMERYGREKGFGQFIKIDLETMSRIKGKKLISDQWKYPQRSFDLKDSDNDPGWLNMVQKKSDIANYCKFPTLFYLEEEKVFRETLNFNIQKEYEKLYSNNRSLHRFPEKYRQKKNAKEIKSIVNIYMAFSQWDTGRQEAGQYEPWITPIQVGSSMSEQRSGEIWDDTGDHISQENGRFAEMTGAYWIWKNGARSTYKGLCHYRRHFVISEKEILSLEHNGIDVILTIPRYVPGGIKNMFLAETPVKDKVYEGMMEAVSNQVPDDAEGFEAYMDSCFYYPNNMVIARSDIYDSYCTWMFPVLFRMAEIDEKTGYGHWKDRHIAYAAELLTSYYFVKNKERYCVAVTDYQLLF